MQLTRLWFDVSAEIEISGEELRALNELSARHYDGACKAASQVGGFLYGTTNSYRFTVAAGESDPTTLPTWPGSVTTTYNSQQLGLLAKICEAENNHALAGGLPVLGSLGQKIAGIQREMNAAWKRVNNEP